MTVQISHLCIKELVCLIKMVKLWKLKSHSRHIRRNYRSIQHFKERIPTERLLLENMIIHLRVLILLISQLLRPSCSINDKEKLTSTDNIFKRMSLQHLKNCSNQNLQLLILKKETPKSHKQNATNNTNQNNCRRTLTEMRLLSRSANLLTIT